MMRNIAERRITLVDKHDRCGEVFRECRQVMEIFDPNQADSICTRFLIGS